MMKKVLIGLIAAAAMTSCVKRQEVTPVENGEQIGSATIKGQFLAKTDYVGDTLPNGMGGAEFELGWSGIAGLTVIATVEEGDLDNDFTSNSAIRSYTTTTDADGNYTLTVDATNKATSVDVRIDGVIPISVTHEDADRAVEDTNNASGYATTTEELTFKVDVDTTVSVIKGQEINLDTKGYEAEEWDM